MKNNYFKYGLYAVGTIAVVVILYFVYKMFARVKSDAGAAADAVADKQANDAIGKQFGTDEYTTANARAIAKDIAVELETYKDMSSWDKLSHMQLDTDTVKIMKRPKSEKELRLVAHFYKNNFTNNNNLYEDLKSELSSSDLRSIKWIESIVK